MTLSHKQREEVEAIVLDLIKKMDVLGYASTVIIRLKEDSLIMGDDEPMNAWRVLSSAIETQMLTNIEAMLRDATKH